VVIDFRGGTTGGPVTFAGLPVDDYAHADEPFAKELFREINAVGGSLHPDPVVGVRTPDFRGDHVNVVDGRRVSLTPANPTLEVWFFGGSTMFGIGQRDDHTIPSVVARLAEADGMRIRATNFGVSGDVNWQETIRFAEALDSDLPRPDLVVFYDGWNDESLGQYRAEIGSGDAGVSERLPFSELDREREPIILGDRERLEPGDERVALGIPLAAAQYGRGVRTARALAEAHGVKALHFWQPIAAVKQYFPSDDELLRRTGLQQRWRDQRVAEYAAIRGRSAVDPIDLSTALDQVDQPVYVDHGHTNELGARVIAQAMYEHLREPLQQLQRQ
jgi:lysophospholipase L1-like esterase